MGARSQRLESHGDEFAWSLLDAAPDAMVIVAEDGAVAYVNDHALELFGLAADDILGQPVEVLVPESRRADHEAHRSRYREHPSVRSMGVGLDLWARRSDGTEFPVEISLSPLVIGPERFAVAAVRDITDRREAEAALQASRDALREAEEVVLVSSDRERIARNLHDTVIQRLFGEGLNLQAALSTVEDPERTRSRIVATIEGLDETIKELRTAIFALQSASRAPGGLRGRILEVTTDAAASLGFEPRLQFDGPIESIDEATAEQLVPVVREALANVARHAGASKVRVAVELSDRVRVTVTDDGAGVPDEVLGGHGLANLAERARELHGTFSIANRPGGGSQLSWEVPVDADGPT